MILSLAGSPNYVAPEVLDGLGYREWADMWSVGVITYILLCGYPPFACEDTRDLLQLILNAEYEYDDDFWSDISAEAKNFVDGLLTLDHHRRLTAQAALGHPWIVSNAGSSSAAPLNIKTQLSSTIKDWKRASEHRRTPPLLPPKPLPPSVPDTSSSPISPSPINSSSPEMQIFVRFARPTRAITAPAPSEVTITRLRAPSVSFYRFLCSELAGDSSLKERLSLSAAQLTQIIADPDVEVLVLYLDGQPAGIAETDFRQSTQQPGEAQLKHLAVAHGTIGRGFGRMLLKSALDRAWARGASRFWACISPAAHPHSVTCMASLGGELYLPQHQTNNNQS